jgi:hypothetical protein
MGVDVTGPDGKDYQFPDGTDKTAAIAYFKKKGIGTKKSALPNVPMIPGLEMRAGGPNTLPKEGSVAQRFGPGVGGYVEAGRQGAEKWLERNAPIVLGTVGGLAGGIPGAIIGGTTAGAIENPGKPVAAVKEGVTQGAYELGGKVLSRVAGKALAPIGERLAPRIAPYLAKYPILKGLMGIPEEQVSGKAAQHLTAAAAEKGSAGQVVEEIGHTIEDIEQELTKIPEKDRTVKGFLNAVNSRKDAMNLEYESALTPIARARVQPVAVAKRVRDLYKPHMAQPEYRAEAKAIAAEARKWDRRWTVEQLDSLRTTLNADLNAFKRKDPVARYVAERGNLNLAIDNAILDGLRESVYPELDVIAGKPAGYFEEMKARQSSLIELQKVLDKRIKDLRGSQAVAEATPRWAPAKNISIYAHAGDAPRGYIHGIQDIISPPRVETEASKHVTKAFPGAKVNEQPYRVLFGTAGRILGPTSDEFSDPNYMNKHLPAPRPH